MVKKSKEKSFALCIENKECEDLEKRKIYAVLPDDEAAKDGYLRIIDESGEDYLYPAGFFFMVELPQTVERALRGSLPRSLKDRSKEVAVERT